MAKLPLRGQSTTPGIYQVCTTANTDYVITVPADAKGVRLWFETSASNAALVNGRVAFANSNTAITGITNTDAVMGYHPASLLEYDLKRPQASYGDQYVFDTNYGTLYLHVANNTALTVVRGQWLFE